MCSQSKKYPVAQAIFLHYLKAGCVACLLDTIFVCTVNCEPPGA